MEVTRVTDTDRTPAKTHLEIAEARAGRLGNARDARLFMETYDTFRKLGRALAGTPLDLEYACREMTRDSTVAHAAMIEALASLRAEGILP